MSIDEFTTASITATADSQVVVGVDGSQMARTALPRAAAEPLAVTGMNQRSGPGSLGDENPGVVVRWICGGRCPGTNAGGPSR